MGAKSNLLIGAAVLAGAVGYLSYLGASNPWRYYLLVDECHEQREQWQGKSLRVSGRVTEGSLRIAPDRRSAAFSLEGKSHRFEVTCPGPLPDNLAEGIEVVVEGRLHAEGGLRGERVITRCASKYAGKNSAEGKP